MTPLVNSESHTEPSPLPVKLKKRPLNVAKRLATILGPGLVTGASDDDPSGIATYSQVGAAFGYGLLWTMLLSYPLMAAIQEICARIGRVTGCGIAGNLRKNYPKPLLYTVLTAVAIANVFNLGADLGAMGDAIHLLIPGKVSIFVGIFGVISLIAILFVPYSRYVKYLKWLTLSLFAYVGVIFLVHISWGEVVHSTLIPHMQFKRPYLTSLAAVFGTTISPYLFFWQASQEVEEVKNNRGEKALKRAPVQAESQLKRIRIDTYVGMAFSNIIAFFIILTAASTLHVHGLTEFPLPPRPPRLSNHWLVVLLSRSLFVESSEPDFWLYRSWPHPLHTELEKLAAGTPVSRGRQNKP